MKCFFKVLLLALFFSTGCSNISKKLISERTTTENLDELESLFNEYSDTITEISVDTSLMSIYLKEQVPNLKTIIDLNEIDSIYYHFVNGNPGWPHQIVLKCSKKSDCLMVYIYYRNNDIVLETYDAEVYMFSDKKASLKAMEILKHLKKIGLKNIKYQ